MGTVTGGLFEHLQPASASSVSHHCLETSPKKNPPTISVSVEDTKLKTQNSDNVLGELKLFVLMMYSYIEVVMCQE